MSILIKGYEMPESCRCCPMEMYYMICGETRCGATNRLLASDFKTIDFEGRADDCPLADVPDTNVGDTVSRQAAIDALKNAEVSFSVESDIDFTKHQREVQEIVDGVIAAQTKAIEQLPPAPEQTGKRYQHYKGGIYEVLCEARHTEQEEELVIYRSVETGAIWARPKGMFFGKIPMGIPRFREVEHD